VRLCRLSNAWRAVTQWRAPSSLRCEGYEKVLAEADAYTPLSLPPALETLPAVRSARVIASN
jgi:hypothetical protein